MHSILLVVNKPNIEEAEANQAWLAFQASIEDSLNNGIDNQDADVPKKLSENILIIPATQRFSIFVKLSALAQSSGFSYQVLFFEEEPQWIQYTP